MKLKIYIILLFCLNSILIANDTLSADQILMKTQLVYSNLNDFQVKARVAADIPNFRMPVKTLEFYYKDPEMFKVKSKGFVLVPKHCLLPFLKCNKMLQKAKNLEIEKWENNQGKKYVILSCLVEIDDQENKISLWIDEYLWRIDKINILRKEQVLSEVEFSYQNLDGFWLPDTTVFTMIFPKGIPKASRPSISDPFGGAQFGSIQSEKDLKGKITINFSDYKINKGIDDEFFEK